MKAPRPFGIVLPGLLFHGRSRSKGVVVVSFVCTHTRTQFLLVTRHEKKKGIDLTTNRKSIVNSLHYSLLNFVFPFLSWKKKKGDHGRMPVPFLSLSFRDFQKKTKRENGSSGRSVGRSLCAFILRVCTQVKRNIRKLQYCHTLVVVALFLSSAHADALQNLHLCLVEDEKEERRVETKI